MIMPDNDDDDSGGTMGLALLIIMGLVSIFVTCFILVTAFINEIQSPRFRFKSAKLPPPPPPPVLSQPTEYSLAIQTIYRILGPKCSGMKYVDALRACEKATHPDLGGNQNDFIAVQKARKTLLG